MPRRRVRRRRPDHGWSSSHQNSSDADQRDGEHERRHEHLDQEQREPRDRRGAELPGRRQPLRSGLEQIGHHFARRLLLPRDAARDASLAACAQRA